MPIESQSRDQGESNEQWLDRNKSLRMDANNELFPQDRREFHLERYRFAKQYVENKDVADAACGTGYGSNLLGETAASVTGIDISQESVDYANATYGNDSVRFLKACVELTPLESNSVDVVVSFETLEHTLSPNAAMLEFARILRPDGMAVISIPNQWGYTKNHFFDFDVPMLKELVATCFQEAELFYQNSGGKRCKGPKGIGKFTVPEEAECVLAVCRGPRKEALPDSHMDFWLDEIYRNSFKRHREFVDLHKRRGGLFGRLGRSLKKRFRRLCR